jgi:hypothetical protein
MGHPRWPGRVPPTNEVASCHRSPGALICAMLGVLGAGSMASHCTERVFRKLAPHFGAGLFSSGGASWYTLLAVRLNFAGDRVHRAGWWS